MVGFLIGGIAGALLGIFVWKFLEKYHTRHLNIPKFNNTRHRHPNNARRRHGEEVKEFDTQDLSKLMRRKDSVLFAAEKKFDPEATLIIEG